MPDNQVNIVFQADTSPMTAAFAKPAVVTLPTYYFVDSLTLSPKPKDKIMPFARIDLAKGKTPEYRATLADVVYQGIVDVLKAPDGDRFVVIGEHSPDNLIYDPHFLGWDRSPDFILIQVTSTVGNNKESKLAFFRYIADELKRKLSVRPDDVMINMVFVDRSDWSFGNGEPWT
jgi:phenylpyruvate tautomerase PptA (4-oxalocrotonate tautomerase family)